MHEIIHVLLKVIGMLNAVKSFRNKIRIVFLELEFVGNDKRSQILLMRETIIIEFCADEVSRGRATEIPISIKLGIPFIPVN